MFSLFWSSHVEKEKLEMATVSTLFFIIPFDFASKDNKGEFWTKCQYGYAIRFLFFFFC